MIPGSLELFSFDTELGAPGHGVGGSARCSGGWRGFARHGRCGRDIGLHSFAHPTPNEVGSKFPPQWLRTAWAKSFAVRLADCTDLIALHADLVTGCAAQLPPSRWCGVSPTARGR